MFLSPGKIKYDEKKNFATCDSQNWVQQGEMLLKTIRMGAKSG